MGSSHISRLACCVFIGICLSGATLADERADFEQWKQAQQADFNQFQTEHDRAFVDFLKQHWEAFEVFKGHDRPSRLKPSNVPRVRHATLNHQSASSQARIPVAQRVLASPDPGQFYGHRLPSIRFPVQDLPSLKAPDASGLAAVWDLLSRQNHTAVLATIGEMRESLALDDFALIRLIDFYLKPYFDSSGQRVAYSWFLLSGMGYDVRVAYAAEELYLLIPVQNAVYGQDYLQLSGKTYYVFPQPEVRQVFSYNGNYKPGLKEFGFTLSPSMKPSGGRERFQTAIAIPGQEITLVAQYEGTLVRFMQDYPQIDLHYYFNAAPSALLSDSLLSQLFPLVEGMEQREAVNFLLLLTQTLFEYQVDQTQFGHEKYLLVEESLHYGINDCEDRSIFLAWLLKSLLGTETVVLDYPNHVALAVKADLRPDDRFVEYRGFRYVIVDPTYIGATAGMVMPSLANVHPDILELMP